MYDFGWQVLDVLLSIGSILFIDTDFTEESEKFRSKVIDIGEDYVMVDYPTNMKTGRTAFILDGTQLFVSFTDKMKISYAFNTEVRGRVMKEVPMLKLVYPGDDKLIKIQRREFVRVETSIDVAVLKDGDYHQFVTEDISAGGIAIKLTEPTLFNKDDIVSLLIVLPFSNSETKYIRTDAKIIRIWEKTDKKIASLQFDNIGINERQLFVKFCFEMQLKMKDK